MKTLANRDRAIQFWERAKSTPNAISLAIPNKHSQSTIWEMQVFLFKSLNVMMNKMEIWTYNQSIFNKIEDFDDSSISKEKKTLRHFLSNKY